MQKIIRRISIFLLLFSVFSCSTVNITKNEIRERTFREYNAPVEKVYAAVLGAYIDNGVSITQRSPYTFLGAQETKEDSSDMFSLFSSKKEYNRINYETYFIRNGEKTKVRLLISYGVYTPKENVIKKYWNEIWHGKQEEVTKTSENIYDQKVYDYWFEQIEKELNR